MRRVHLQRTLEQLARLDRAAHLCELGAHGALDVGVGRTFLRRQHRRVRKRVRADQSNTSSIQ